MLDFHTPTLEDKEWIETLAENCGQIGCDISFATTYLWRNVYNIQVCNHDGVLYKAYFSKKQKVGYAFPIGNKPPKEMIDEIIKDANARGVKPLIGMMNKTNAEILYHLYPDTFEFTEERSDADYIYSRENLATLPGKKYHAKRNHISKFKRNNVNYCYKEIDSSNKEDAYFVAHKWHMNNKSVNTDELKAIREALDKFEELGLFGGVLYVDGRAVAMTIASKINSTVCDVNFEKALDVDGAYAVINNEFAKSHDEFLQFNREEDLGLEGLRKSKLSYHPDKILMKHTATMK
ncbi:MAG: DUF2156 domain-containing protein [Ruminococcus sp.]|nr:DUF2156 domain-containing protein [Ruminococcus sp.]